ncbi:MAG TPA: pyruvate formate lyase family protein, partial [Anaerolineae bacterium]
IILPPPDKRKIVKTVSGSGVEMSDVLLDGVQIVSNDPNGGFYGPRACGENFRNLLLAHPVYIDPLSSLAGGYMANFFAYRKGGLPTGMLMPDFTQEYEKYKGGAPIFGSQHFCQDLQIGLDLGWGGLLDKIRHYRDLNVPAEHDPHVKQHMIDFYAGLEAVVLGVQDWIGRHAEEARQLARKETNPLVRRNLEQMAAINEWLVTEKPRTFQEACQWIAWYQMVSRMYNGSGSLGRLDVLLQPYYEHDTAAGTLTDEEAIFHIACFYLCETGYIQIGGPDASGKEVTSPVSYLVLEAAHRLRIPVNLGICVGKDVPRQLLRRAVEIICQDKAGVPKFLGIDNTTSGFARNGFPMELARTRAYSGCHWSSIPGREYTLNDGAKINLAAVFDVAYQEMLADATAQPSTEALWKRFEHHLRASVESTARGFDFHMEHMIDFFPEIVMDLLCYGPVEKGLDASQKGGVEYVNWCVDGAALATVADSFAALKVRVETEKRITWQELAHYIKTDWAGPEGERARLMMKNIPRYGSGGTVADDYAVRVSNLFTEIVKEKPTPQGFNMIPGLFSWAAQISMGKGIGATPNGRHVDAPISHGCNPDPGFRKDGAPTALAVATARVQSGYGNSAPLQLDLDPMVSSDADGVDKVMSLIQSHFELGGTQINLNVMDKAKVLEANKDPSKYPDLIVRVTGFSAYFASLSPEFRQIVVDRIVSEG